MMIDQQRLNFILNATIAKVEMYHYKGSKIIIQSIIKLKMDYSLY